MSRSLFGLCSARSSLPARSSLQELPFETGSFDMVHIRFVGLGVPESMWGDLFSEAARVLKGSTGVLEVSICLFRYETSY